MTAVTVRHDCRWLSRVAVSHGRRVDTCGVRLMQDDDALAVPVELAAGCPAPCPDYSPRPSATVGWRAEPTPETWRKADGSEEAT